MDGKLLEELLVAVEQQIASPETPYVGEAYQRLLDSGMSEADAKSEIAHCLAGEMNEMLLDNREFDEELYKADLEGMPYTMGDLL